MPKNTEEIKVNVCWEHRETYLSAESKGFIFNSYLMYPSKRCHIKDCEEDAFYTLIGIRIPDNIPTLTLEDKYRMPVVEIFTEAKELLDYGPALNAVARLIYSKIVPSEHRQFLARKLCTKMAYMILEKLKIDKEASLTDRNKHKVIMELGLYPEDMPSF